MACVGQRPTLTFLAAGVIEIMIQIRMEMGNDDQRAAELGLGEDELAFYDAVSRCTDRVYEQEFLCELIHDVVQTIKRNATGN
ncbi:DUF3387 domain-containing protein [Acidobacteria bacterium AH-259-O06]|nr:DUF3387 domain-containing protein [Acidobacteria bacterium AH-259-O06]